MFTVKFTVEVPLSYYQFGRDDHERVASAIATATARALGANFVRAECINKDDVPDLTPERIAMLEKHCPDLSEELDEEWLRASGFKWHEFDRSGGKHWVLWMGSCIAAQENKSEALRTGRAQCWSFTDDEDLGIEVAALSLSEGGWFCWLRGDSSHRYHRFIHLKHIFTRIELVRLIEGITGMRWKPENHRYGSIHTDEQMERIRQHETRPDRVMLHQGTPWYDSEKDEFRGRPLIEHMEAAEQRREAAEQRRTKHAMDLKGKADEKVR